MCEEEGGEGKRERERESNSGNETKEVERNRWI